MQNKSTLSRMFYLGLFFININNYRKITGKSLKSSLSSCKRISFSRFEWKRKAKIETTVIPQRFTIQSSTQQLLAVINLCSISVNPAKIPPKVSKNNKKLLIDFLPKNARKVTIASAVMIEKPVKWHILSISSDTCIGAISSKIPKTVQETKADANNIFFICCLVKNAAGQNNSHFYYSLKKRLIKP